MKNVAVFVVLLLSAGVVPIGRAGAADAGARAGLTARQKEQERKAIASFAAGRYEEAVNIYSDLYADFRDPVYLRNIGRCYQKLRKADSAISSFEEYLARAKRITPAEQDEIRGYITEMEALRRKQQSETGATIAPAEVPPPPVAPPPSVTATPSAVAQPAAELSTTPSARRSTGLRWAAGGTLGAAVVMAIGGGVMLSAAWSRYHDADGKCGAQGPGACIGAANTISSRSTLSKVFFVGAALLGVAGGTLLYLDLSHPDSGTTLVGLGGNF